MEVVAQAPQPTIKCFHSFKDNKATQELYQKFTPSSSDVSGKNLQSYNFERSLENFGGSFSFTIKEDTEHLNDEPFMDKVQPLDVIVISESGYEEKADFIGVVTTISVGSIASNLNKVVTVSGKSIEWLFSFYNINCDIKCTIFNNDEANKMFKADLANKDGEEGISIKDIVVASIDTFRTQVSKIDGGGSSVISNFLIGDLIDTWFKDDYIEASKDKFAYPISSNMFDSGHINVIDYLKKLLPSPIYEIFSYIDDKGNPKLVFRMVPYDNPKAAYTINPTHLTDYTLTRNCEEVYTAFMTYIEGTDLSPDFYMNLATVEEEKLKGYNFSQPSKEKAAKYGYQLLTCSFVGYNDDPKAASDNQKIQEMNEDLERWFSKLDEMYNGDFTLVNYINEKNGDETIKKAKIGDWLSFAKGLYYVVSEKHSWSYGDNPMINYQVTRGGEYSGNDFKPVQKLSAIYKELE